VTEKAETEAREAPARPLLFGRLLRVLSGAALLGALAAFLPASLLLLALLAFLGVSLILGGVLAHPGCEIFVLPSLLARRQLQCF
jgi:hypothetical protein